VTSFPSPRARRVAALYEHLDEALPDISRVEGTDAGFVPSRLRPCGACVYGRRQGRLCAWCEGTGWRQRVPEDDDRVWDPYDVERRPVSGEDRKTSRTMTSAELDGELERLAADAATREGRIDHERYGWEKRRRVLETHGDFRRLRAVLDMLRQRDHAAYAAMPAPWACEIVAQLMPGKIRLPRWLDARVGEEIREDVLSLHRLGLDLEEIAAAVGLKPRVVKRMTTGSAIMRVQGSASMSSGA
jgi:hypothetical protein